MKLAGSGGINYTYPTAEMWEEAYWPKERLTKEVLHKKLVAIATNSIHDLEADHSEADKLLLQYINDKDITEAFEEIDKWYA